MNRSNLGAYLGELDGHLLWGLSLWLVLIKCLATLTIDDLSGFSEILKKELRSFGKNNKRIRGSNYVILKNWKCL
ncbi:unnamed protein product [Rhizophagus irregularis]|nr:unnamed protein product [Rhizophagus irregularis]